MKIRKKKKLYKKIILSIMLQHKMRRVFEIRKL